MSAKDTPGSTPKPPVRPAPAGGAFEWKRFAGEKIAVHIPKSKTGAPLFEGAARVIPDFERRTGIQVQLTRGSVGDNQGDFDVRLAPLDSSGFRMAAGGELTVLSRFLDDPAMTSPDYDFGDFVPRLRRYASFSGDSDVYYAIPFLFESYILMYNKELVAKYVGDACPRYMPELIELGAKITAEVNPKKDPNGLFGLMQRGVVSGGIDTTTGVVLDRMGCDRAPPLPFNVWFEGDWLQPRLGHPAILDGLRTFCKVLEAGPREEAGQDWDFPLRHFLAGQCVFFIGASQFTVIIESSTPEAEAAGYGSKVAGITGYRALPPAAPGSPTATAQWQLGWVIPSASENQGPAWYFIQFMSNKENAAAVAAPHAGAPRASTWTDPAYTRSLCHDFLDAAPVFLGTSHTSAIFSVHADQVVAEIDRVMKDILGGAEPHIAAARADLRLREYFERVAHGGRPRSGGLVV